MTTTKRITIPLGFISNLLIGLCQAAVFASLAWYFWPSITSTFCPGLVKAGTIPAHVSWTAVFGGYELTYLILRLFRG